MSCKTSDCTFFGNPYCSKCTLNIKIAKSDEPIEEKPKELSKKHPKHCQMVGCKRKLGLVSFDCRCSRKFCDEHRLSSVHNCEFDYKNKQKIRLGQENVKIEFQKIEKI